MAYEITRDGERLDVNVGGRLDAAAAPELSDAMRPKLDGVTEIVFNLGELEYISSAGLRVLLASYKLMMKRGGTMRVEGAQAGVTEVLEVSGFASLFGIDE